MQAAPFKTIHASVRPARVAILIDKDDKAWQHTCLRIIEFYSTIWGGGHNIIVPTDGKQLDERFWRLLEAFDPDHLYRYAKSGEDIFLSDPERYNQYLEEEVQRNIKQSGASSVEATRKNIDEALRGAWLQGQFEVTASLQDDIKRRIAPFWFEQLAVNPGAITAGASPPWPLTRMTGILPYTQHPDSVAVVGAPTDQLPTLWYSSVTGRLSSSGLRAFEEIEIVREAFQFTTDNISQLVEFTLNRTTRRRRATLPSGVLVDLETAAPFNISMIHLGLYRSVRYREWREPTLLVAGNSVEDFCLFYCLSRIRNGVAWVPPSITDKALGSNPDVALSTSEMSFLFRIRDVERSSESEAGLACLSYSLPSTDVDKVIGQLNRYGADRFSNPIGKTDQLERLTQLPITPIEKDTFQRDLVLQFAGDWSVSPFATPKPKHFDPIHPSEHRYITQLSIAGDAPPKHANLGLTILPIPGYTTEQVRIGKDGPAYLCPNIMYFGGDIDSVLVRPRLHLPPLHKILENLAEKHGYECRPSDKGIYADESISKWGGLDEIGRFLRSKQNRELLEHFLDDSKSERGKGVYLSDRRRYLDLAAIRSHVGDKVVGLIDELVSKEVLYRGFIFGCSYCRNADWFSIADIAQDFKCGRCGRTQVYRKHNWKDGDEPIWFYKLDELVYQGYRNNMDVALLALTYLKEQSQESFTFTTDREFWKTGAGKPTVEADFFCVRDGVFTAGEAKTEDNLGSSAAEEQEKITKYMRLTKKLGVRQLVLATLSPDWHPETVEAVLSAFAEVPSVRVLFLSASQLA